MSESNTCHRRKLLHNRQVTCTGYLRDDGMIDIEGRLLDTKTHDFTTLHKTVAAGQPFHLMHLRITADLDFVIHQVHAVTETAPLLTCPDIAPAYQKLVGLQVGAGFTRKVAERVGGIQGCTHLTELLGPMATTLFQTASELRRNAQQQRAASDPEYVRPEPFVIGTCHTYHPDGEPARYLRQIWREGRNTLKPEED